MLRDNLVELIEPRLNNAGADPLALWIHKVTRASEDRLPCLKNPRPEGAESSLTENAFSPFQAEPAQRTVPSNASNARKRLAWCETSPGKLHAQSSIKDLKLRTTTSAYRRR